MSLIRIPTAIEHAMWPDDLPAGIVVPAGYTWFVPGDLDLSGTDVVVNGNIQFATSPPPAADTDTAGLVELATVAEDAAGMASNLASTPAGVAAAIAAGIPADGGLGAAGGVTPVELSVSGGVLDLTPLLGGGWGYRVDEYGSNASFSVPDPTSLPWGTLLTLAWSSNNPYVQAVITLTAQGSIVPGTWLMSYDNWRTYGPAGLVLVVGPRIDSGTLSKVWQVLEAGGWSP